MIHKRKLMLLQTRYIESISYLTAEIVKAFPLDQYEITMVYLESGESDANLHQCFSLGLTKTDYKGLRLKAIAKLKDFLQDHQYDVIIANMYKPINLLMQLRRLVSASLCIGIIHTFGEFDRLGRRLMMRWMIDSRWKIVGVSQALCDYLIQANCGLNSTNTVAINNAIDIKLVVSDAIDSVRAREILKLPASGMVFGTVGRCVKGKRHLELVKAFHLLMAKRQDVFLIIIGDGELHPELVAYVKTHQLQDCVILAGYIPKALDYLKALDVFVFPSESEGFGIALLEAMSLSLPVIVNNVEPLNTIVSDMDAVVDTHKPDLLMQMLEKYCQYSTAELERKGTANYRRVCEQYAIEDYQRAYHQLVEQHFINR